MSLPTVISFEDLRTLYSAARGQKSWRDRATLEAGHNLVGYGLNQLVLDEVSIGASDFDDEAAIAVLGDLSVEPPAGVSAGPGVAIALLVLRPLAKWTLKKILENL